MGKGGGLVMGQLETALSPLHGLLQGKVGDFEGSNQRVVLEASTIHVYPLLCMLCRVIVPLVEASNDEVIYGLKEGEKGAWDERGATVRQVTLMGS